MKLKNLIEERSKVMIKFCSICSAEVEVDRDNEPINVICKDCEHDLDMEKKNENSRNNISRNGPWHNV